MLLALSHTESMSYNDWPSGAHIHDTFARVSHETPPSEHAQAHWAHDYKNKLCRARFAEVSASDIRA